MEFYLSFGELAGKISNPVSAVFLPIFLILTALEAMVIIWRSGTYPWKNASVSLCMALGHLITQAAAHGLILSIIAAAIYKIRLTTIPVSFNNWTNLIILFLLVDLGFYVEHRCSHRIKLLWASHSVHHSSEKMQATTAFRLSWTPILSGVFAFYLPIVWIGYDPVWVYGMVSGSLAYQFFVHTELAPRVGWLEWVINTPSAHRVHHASNPEYIDKNFGGILLIWDHLFGSYQAEQRDITIRYGLAHQRSSPNNPFVIAYEELWLTLKAARQAGSLRGAVLRLWEPP
jgi:sterol desaturase/sphingolipid hydroxylase (fatty acid hydroxylase superfamily)